MPLTNLKPFRALRFTFRIFKTLLIDYGYLPSVLRGEIRSPDGYVPWFTYPAIEALKAWDLSERSVLEYGSGYSTLFWANRARTVVSIEHNQDWFEKIKGLAPPNVTMILAPINEAENDYHPSEKTRAEFRAYAESHGEGKFDLIVLDGYARSRMRYQCAQASLPHLKPGGMVILDNSDWCPATCLFLRESGLIQIDFSGFVPGNNCAQTTSFFLSPGFSFQHNQRVLPIGGTGHNWEKALEQELLDGQVTT